MFGIYLPLNFNSPYKATNIVEFWRRWHITLSRFLREYVYIPLGGNQKGRIRRYINLMITMLLGGIWHGAGWTFVFWGALHGFYLIINHAWNAVRRSLGQDLSRTNPLGRGIARILTLLSVIVGWVFFRAESFDAAFLILKGMFLFPEAEFTTPHIKDIDLFGINAYLDLIGLQFTAQQISVLVFGSLLVLVIFAPNTQEILIKHKPALDSNRDKNDSRPIMQWQPTRLWATGISIMALWAIMGLTGVSEFLYFQF
jgi:hypothetical protein